MGKQAMRKQNQRSGLYKMGNYCESCHCHVSQGNWQQHIEGIRHRVQMLQKTYGADVISQFQSVPPLSEGPAKAPSQDARSLVAALVGTGRIYHKALKALSRAGDLLQGHSRVEEAADGRGHAAHTQARPILHAVPLDVQVAGDCVDDALLHALQHPVDAGEVTSSQTGSSNRHAGNGEERVAPDSIPRASRSQLIMMDTDGPTLMCLADHLNTASYNLIHVGILQPIQAVSVKGTAAMAALACVIRALKTCYKLESLSLTFQLNHEEAQQAMCSQLPPIPKPIMEELQGLVTCHALWIKSLQVSRHLMPSTSGSDCHDLCQHWQLLRRAEVHARRLAILMGRHARLGSNCPWRSTPDEALQMILDSALPLHCDVSIYI